MHDAAGEAMEVQLNATAGDGDILRHFFRGPAQAALLAVDQASPTAKTRTVWTFADTAGTVTTTGWFDTGDPENPLDDTWRFYHRRFDPQGNVVEAKSGGDDEPALQNVPVVWRGLRQNEVSDLYLAGLTVYDPQSGRYLSQAAPGDSNPYRFEGNRPTSPDPPSAAARQAPESRGIIRGLIGDETLLNASDAQLIGAVTVFSVRVGLTAGLGLAAVGGGLTIGGTTLGGLATANVALGTASLTASGTRFALTGGGTDDVLSDVASLGASALLPSVSGLAKSGLIAADVAANLYQGGKSSVFAAQAFRQGDIRGGVIGALGATLGFSSGFARGLELNILFRTDPFANPLNYRLRFDATATLNSTGVGNVGLEFNGPRRIASSEILRERLGNIFVQEGIDLRSNEFFIHGASTRYLDSAAEPFRLNGIDPFFTAINFEAARIFGQRSIQKAGGGQLDAILVILNNDTFRALKGRNLVRSGPISGFEQFQETVFAPAAADLINRQGRFIRLGVDFFLE